MIALALLLAFAQDADYFPIKTGNEWTYAGRSGGRVSEREGAEVVRNSSWGLENRQTGDRTEAVNHTNFTGRNPWSGEQLNEVNTRAEYEKYIRGR